MQKIVCYLCGRENRCSYDETGRCATCGALLVDIVACTSCGAINRVLVRFVEHQKIYCGRCQHLLTDYQLKLISDRPGMSSRTLCNTLIIEGKLHQWRGEWEKATHLFQEAQGFAKNAPQEYFRLAVSIALCHAYLGNYEKAMEFLKDVSVPELEEFSVFYELARTYALTGDLERALVYFECALKLRSDSSSGKYFDNLLSSLYDIRDADTAGPISLQTCVLLYDALQDYETQNVQAGIQKLRRALELDPMDSKMYFQLGWGLLQQQECQQAVKMLEQCLEFDPLHEQAQFILGDAYFSLGLYECALNAYRQTLHINPHNIDAYHHLGLVYEKQGRLDLAKGYWEDVLKVAPQHKDALQSLQRYLDTVNN